MERSWEPGAVTGMLERSRGRCIASGRTGSRLWTGRGRLPPVRAQTQAILDLRLHQLTGLEQDKIVNEYKELLELIDELLAILQDPDRLMQVIREELESTA